MAQKVHVIITDDIDGSEGASTRTFGLDGANYEIDLSDKNYDKLVSALEPYLNKARKAGRSTGGRKSATQSGPAAKDIREWAKSNWSGDVPERGRIPAEVREAYEAAH